MEFFLQALKELGTGGIGIIVTGPWIAVSIFAFLLYQSQNRVSEMVEVLMKSIKVISELTSEVESSQEKSQDNEDKYLKCMDEVRKLVGEIKEHLIRLQERK